MNGEKHAGKGEGGGKVADKAGTGGNTPKKKISLDAYKKKQSGATPVGTPLRTSEQPVRKPAAKAPVKGPVERIKEDEEVLAGMDAESPAVTAPVAEKTDAKRKREDSVGDEGEAQKRQKRVEPRAVVPETELATTVEDKTGPATAPQSQENVSPQKIPAKTSPPATKVAKPNKELPPKLSPPPPAAAPKDTSLPPKLSPIASLPPLPPRLSPTLPTNIAETLKARENYRSASRSSDVSATGRNLTPPRQEGKTGPLKKSPRNGFRANSSSPAVRSDVEERGRPVSSVPKNDKAAHLSEESQDEIAVAKSKQAAPEKPRSLVVKLKFKKATRETVRRILKMRPNPDKNAGLKDKTEIVRRSSSAADARHREQREAGAKGVAQKVGPVKATINGEQTKDVKKAPAKKDHKRTRSDDSESEERSVKRPKASVDSPEKNKERQPSTPNKPDLHSPSAAQRTMATPGNMRKDLLSTSMRREKSTDSNYNTPSAQDQTSPPDTTASQSQTNGTNKHPPSSQPSTKTPKQAAWEAEQKRLEMLGRELKHGATAHLLPLAAPNGNNNSDSNTSQTSTNEQKLAAIKALESLLAYLLAFTCADEAALAADPKQNPTTRTWRSMQQYYGFVKKNCEPFPSLLGLACWLGVVFNARILELGGNALSSQVMVETTAMMMKAAHDAESKLDINAIEQTFPGMWDRRYKGGHMAEDKLEPGRGFKGSFSLPLGLQTSPLKAARAGWEMLQEWVGGQEGVGYELKLKL
jgi:hypothetical protein